MNVYQSWLGSLVLGEVVFQARVILLRINELMTIIILNLIQPYNLTVTSMMY